MEEESEGEGSEAEIVSRESEERERIKSEAFGPKAPKVSRMKGMKREEESAVREETWIP